MVQAYRLLAEEQYNRGWDYPLHLGVTEAGAYPWRWRQRQQWGRCGRWCCGPLHWRLLPAGLQPHLRPLRAVCGPLHFGRRARPHAPHPLPRTPPPPGEGEDGRMKSAIGIGALLMDGLGDTIRVSLTEDPEYEMDPCGR